MRSITNAAERRPGSWSNVSTPAAPATALAASGPARSATHVRRSTPTGASWRSSGHARSRVAGGVRRRRPFHRMWKPCIAPRTKS